MTELIKSLILGIVEGLTEWLPISSTGHMILVNELMGNSGFTSTDLYLYVIQLGAILAVITAFFGKLNPFWGSKEKRLATWQMWFKVAVATVPAGVFGLLLNDYMDAIENWQVVSAMLILYGVAFLIAERKKERRVMTADIDSMSYKTALLIGLFQVLAVVPGTSRSGATILGAMLLGCSREIAAEFAFFLAIPIMFGISFVKIVKFEGALSGGDVAALLVGMAAAYAVSLAAIKFLISFVKKHDFKAFGWYRIVLGLLVIGFFCVIK